MSENKNKSFEQKVDEYIEKITDGYKKNVTDKVNEYIKDYNTISQSIIQSIDSLIGVEQSVLRKASVDSVEKKAIKSFFTLLNEERNNLSTFIYTFDKYSLPNPFTRLFEILSEVKKIVKTYNGNNNRFLQSSKGAKSLLQYLNLYDYVEATILEKEKIVSDVSYEDKKIKIKFPKIVVNENELYYKNTYKINDDKLLNENKEEVNTSFAKLILLLSKRYIALKIEENGNNNLKEGTDIFKALEELYEQIGSIRIKYITVSSSLSLSNEKIAKMNSEYINGLDKETKEEFKRWLEEAYNYIKTINERPDELVKSKLKELNKTSEIKFPTTGKIEIEEDTENYTLLITCNNFFEQGYEGNSDNYYYGKILDGIYKDFIDQLPNDSFDVKEFLKKEYNWSFSFNDDIEDIAREILNKDQNKIIKGVFRTELVAALEA